MTWSVLPIVAVWFLIPVILPVSGNNESYDPPTVKNRICPAEFWKIVESNNNVHCYSIVTIPDDRSPIGNYLCRKLNPHAKLASFHSQAQVDVAYVFEDYTYNLTTEPRYSWTAYVPLDYTYYLTTGLTYEFDEYVWQDGTPVNYTLWAPGHPSMNDSNAIVELGSDEYNDKFLRTATLTNVTRRYALCKMEAEPMQKCSQTVVSPTCESGWVQRNTYHHVSCYTNLSRTYDINDEDVCARNLAGSYLTSIHNKDENGFIKEQGYKWSKLGLHIPPSKQHLPIHRDLFEWTDGTPVDFTYWDTDWCQYGCPGQSTNEYNCSGHSISHYAFWSLHGGINLAWVNIDDNQDAVCKKSYRNCYQPST